MSTAITECVFQSHNIAHKSESRVTHSSWVTCGLSEERFFVQNCSNCSTKKLCEYDSFWWWLSGNLHTAAWTVIPAQASVWLPGLIVIGHFEAHIRLTGRQAGTFNGVLYYLDSLVLIYNGSTRAFARPVKVWHFVVTLMCVDYGRRMNGVRAAFVHIFILWQYD